MKKGLIIKTVYILVLCISISTVAFTSSADVYEGYYQSIFDVIDLMYYRGIGINNIRSTALNGAMTGMNEYSCFVLNEQIEEPNSNTGVFLENVRTGLKVVSVIPDSSAFNAGIEVGDTIILIDKMNTAVMSEDYFNSYISGKNSALIRYIDYETGEINSAVLESDTTSGRDVEFVYLENAGYLRINRFSEYTTDRTAGILESMKKMGSKNIIVDLRSLNTMNLDDACAFADLLIPSGTIARSGSGTYNASYKKIKLEIAVIVDDKTTGAAEAVAMALPGTVYGVDTVGYAVYANSYPVFSQHAYDFYVNLTGKTEIPDIVRYLERRDIEIKDSLVTGFLNIVESDVYASNRRRINKDNFCIPDVTVEDTSMGYNNYSPGAYVIDIERNYQEGSLNYDVFIAKKILGLLGFYSGEYNVQFDKNMVDAVNEYKLSMGFSADGVLDIDTQAALNTYSMIATVNEDACVKIALEDFAN